MSVDAHGVALLDCTREEERRQDTKAALHVVSLATGGNNRVLAFTTEGIIADADKTDGLIQQCHQAVCGLVHAAVRSSVHAQQQHAASPLLA